MKNLCSESRVPCGQTDGWTDGLIQQQNRVDYSVIKLYPKQKSKLFFMASALHTKHTVSQCSQIVRYMKVENGLVCVCVWGGLCVRVCGFF